MGKIKINLSNGSSLEKPLVTCFKGTNGDYIILDNEMNGSMGLPIICVSKFGGTKAEKIINQSEWASVKDNLKTIISGTTLPYLNVPAEISASDDFFTQLTLPTASFDLLKKSYAPAEEKVETVEVTVPDSIVEVPAVDTDSEDVPTINPEPLAAAPVVEAVQEAPAVPEIPEIVPPVVEPVVPEVPTVEIPSAVDTVVNTSEVVAEPAVEQPVVESEVVSEKSDNADIQSIKDNFMKSCETMFDALIKKFENK